MNSSRTSLGSVPVAALVFYAVVMLCLGQRLRFVHGDEAAYLDPAINLATGRGFTSTAWSQPPTAVWAGNVPLHALASAGWMRLTEPTLAAGRRLSAVLFTGGLALALAGAVRLGLLPTPGSQLLFVALCLCSLYTTSVAQFARPDALCFFILALAFWAFSVQPAAWRLAALATAGFLAILAGLQLLVVMITLSTLLLCFTRFRFMRELSACGVGVALGAAALGLVYARLGVLDALRAATLGAGANRAQWQGFREPLLWAGIAVALIAGPWLRLLERHWLRVALATFSAALAIPLVLFALSKFPQYYAFFAAVPMALALSISLPRCFSSFPLVVKIAAIALLAGASAVGLPLRFLMSWNVWPQTDPSHLAAFCGRIAPEAAVFCEPGSYFSVRPAAQRTFTQFALTNISPPDASSIEFLLLPTDSGLEYLTFETVSRKVGGAWRPLAKLDIAAEHPAKSQAIAALGRLSYMAAPRLTLWQRADPEPGVSLFSAPAASR